MIIRLKESPAAEHLLSVQVEDAVDQLNLATFELIDFLGEEKVSWDDGEVGLGMTEVNSQTHLRHSILDVD